MLPLTRCYLALVYDELEEYEEVIAGLTDVLANDPGNVVALNNRGLAYAEIGNTEAAEHDFAAAIALGTSEAAPFTNWGDLLLRSGNSNGALERYRQAQIIRADDAYLARKIAALVKPSRS